MKTGYINARDYKVIELPADEEWIMETNGAWASEKMIKWAKEITNAVNILKALPTSEGKKE